MESATLRRAPPLPALLQAGLICLLLIGAVIAWTVTDDRMSGMDAGPATDLGELGWFLGIWVVMMAAMMFPSIWPMVLMYARVQEGRHARGREVPAGAMPLFVAGYLITWGTAGVVAYGLIEIGESLNLDFLAWGEAGQYVAGGVLIAAAIYQLTPLKDVCLTKCRNPLSFILHSWKPGRLGALRMGIEHGAWCVGCCWALMAALFALGVMSIGWMALIAAFIALEKLLPWKAVANRGIAVMLVVLGLAVAIVPEDIPGLVLPNSPEAAAAMENMGMEGGAMEDDAMEDDPMPAGGMEDDAMPAGGGMKDEGTSGSGMNDEAMP